MRCMEASWRRFYVVQPAAKRATLNSSMNIRIPVVVKSGLIGEHTSGLEIFLLEWGSFAGPVCFWALDSSCLFVKITSDADGLLLRPVVASTWEFGARPS